MEQSALPIAVAVVVGALLLVFALIRRQGSEYSQHVKQLKPQQEKRSKPPAEFKVYTREEVAKHSSADDAWVIIRDKDSGELRVYDVTPYVDEHPGGDSILNNVGKEATEGFHGPQHPDGE